MGRDVCFCFFSVLNVIYFKNNHKIALKHRKSLKTGDKSSYFNRKSVLNDSNGAEYRPEKIFNVPIRYILFIHFFRKSMRKCSAEEYMLNIHHIRRDIMIIIRYEVL
jgi:hypothetical protein